MAYWDWRPGNYSTTVTPVCVCVHGLTRNGRDFDVVARALVKRGYRVVCPDIVGRGVSDTLTNSAEYGYDTYVPAVAALISSVSNETNPIDYIGTSMGGLIGMFLAAKASVPIRSMLINDVGPVVAKVSLQRLAQYVGKDPTWPTLEQAQTYLERVYASFAIPPGPMWREFTRISVRPIADGEGWERCYDRRIRDAFAATDPKDFKDIELWPIWDNVRVERLAVMRGGQSTLLTQDTLDRMTEQGPSFETIAVPDAGHAPALMDGTQVQQVLTFMCPKADPKSSA